MSAVAASVAILGEPSPCARAANESAGLHGRIDSNRLSIPELLTALLDALGTGLSEKDRRRLSGRLLKEHGDDKDVSAAISINRLCKMYVKFAETYYRRTDGV